MYADARENLMEAAHIRPLISLLKVIDNPAQDIYLAAAMRGPMFGFTDDDLVRPVSYTHLPADRLELAADRLEAALARGELPDFLREREVFIDEFDTCLLYTSRCV